MSDSKKTNGNDSSDSSDDSEDVRMTITIPKVLMDRAKEEAHKLGGLSMASMFRMILAQRYPDAMSNETAATS
jgi:hypothetical protein